MDNDQYATKYEGDHRMEGSNMDALIAGFLANGDRNRSDEWAPWMMAMMCNGGFNNRGGCGGYGGHDGYKDYGYHDHRHHDEMIVEETNFGKILDSVDGHGFRQEEALCDLRKEVSDKFCQVDRDVLDKYAQVDKDVLLTQGLIREKSGDLTHIVDKCCCDTNRHMDAIAYDELKAIDKGFCETNKHIDKVDCDVKTSKLELDYLIEKKNAEVCNRIDKGFCDQTNLINSKFAELDSKEKDREICALKEALMMKNAELSQNAQTQIILRAIEKEC